VSEGGIKLLEEDGQKPGKWSGNPVGGQESVRRKGAGKTGKKYGQKVKAGKNNWRGLSSCRKNNAPHSSTGRDTYCDEAVTAGTVASAPAQAW